MTRGLTRGCPVRTLCSAPLVLTSLRVDPTPERRTSEALPHSARSTDREGPATNARAPEGRSEAVPRTKWTHSFAPAGCDLEQSIGRSMRHEV
jgi:hypothetical protein